MKKIVAFCLLIGFSMLVFVYAQSPSVGKDSCCASFARSDWKTNATQWNSRVANRISFKYADLPAVIETVADIRLFVINLAAHNSVDTLSKNCIVLRL